MISNENAPALLTVNYRKEKLNSMSRFRLHPQLSGIGKKMRVIGLVDATSAVGSMMGATNVSEDSGIETTVKTDIRISTQIE